MQLCWESFKFQWKERNKLKLIGLENEFDVLITIWGNGKKAILGSSFRVH